MAQESDWLERLEKKLRKSSSNTAADAEEISEELNAIENFLDNHPEDRLRRIRTLAESLTKKNILISTWLDDAKRLEERWGELKKRAKYVFMRVLFLMLPPSMIYLIFARLTRENRPQNLIDIFCPNVNRTFHSYPLGLSY